MMDRLDNPSKIKAFELSEELKGIMSPLYAKHQDDIISGAFSRGMMADWDNDDANLLKWRAATADTAEYGCYLYDQACAPLLGDFMSKVDPTTIGAKFNNGDNGVDNAKLVNVNAAIRAHPVEVVGRELRGYLSDMESISVGDAAAVAARAAGLEWAATSNQA